MRFGDGAWRMLPDVDPAYLSRVDAVAISEREVVLHVSSRPEETRWATLYGHMFTVRLSSPLANVFRVQVAHHRGRVQRGPHFEITAEPQPLRVRESADGISLLSGELELLVSKNPWSLSFIDARSGKTITSSPFKALGSMDKQGHGVFMRDQLTLGVGEQVYGLGERFQAFTRNGQTVDMWNADCGTCSDKSYKDVPVFITSRGYAVFVNSPARVSFEVGTEQVMRAQFAVPGHDLDYFLVHGPEPKAALCRLSEIVGKPALPPAWSFGLWLTTSFTTQYDERTVMEFIDGMRDRQLPLHVFHFDCFWMKAHHWCNFRFDEQAFPEPEAMLARLRQRGLHVCLWINPYIAERSHLFDEGVQRGYLLKRPNGDVYQRPKWQAGMGYVDFTNPEACKWFKRELRHLLRLGVDAFKTDFGEEIPTDVVYHDGSDPLLMHQYYTYLYNKTVFEVLSDERGPGEACLFARSATATCGQFPVHWGGDSSASYESMAESLRGGLSLMLSGFGFWSHDIGGFEKTATPAVYKRWVAFGLLSSHSRLHGNASYRVPWLFDEESVGVLRHFTHLKCRLMPYLRRTALETHQTGVPMMRPMLLEFPDDPAARNLDRQYMLGPSLLVAPVFDDAIAEYYLPAGCWTQLLTGEVREGGRWFREEHDFFSVPLWLRAGHAVAVGPEQERVDYDYTVEPRMIVGKVEEGSSLRVEIPGRAGQIDVYEIEQREGRLHVDLRGHGAVAAFEVHLPWVSELEACVGGEPQSLAGAARSPLCSTGVLLAAKQARVSAVARSRA